MRKFAILTFATEKMWISRVSLFANAYGSVQLDVALAVLSTRVQRARVHAFLVVASLVVGTLGVIGALGLRHC